VVSFEPQVLLHHGGVPRPIRVGNV
jgi:hypothetical protein